MKDERVEIFIPRASDREDPNLFAAVNGVNYLLPRGKKSCVPKSVADEIEQKFPKLNGKVEIYSVGTTIGSHTGPGTVALFFWGDERKD